MGKEIAYLGGGFSKVLYIALALKLYPGFNMKRLCFLPYFYFFPISPTFFQAPVLVPCAWPQRQW